MNYLLTEGEFFFVFWLSPHFSRGQNTENPVPRSFFAPKPHGIACYAGYGFSYSGALLWNSLRIWIIEFLLDNLVNQDMIVLINVIFVFKLYTIYLNKMNGWIWESAVSATRPSHIMNE